MARTPSTPSGLVASAATIDLATYNGHSASYASPADYSSIGAGPTQWQSECYRHYRICGEASYAANFLARAVKRAKLTSDDQRTNALLDLLYSGSQSESAFLERLALQLVIAGEAFIIGRAPTPAEKRANPALGNEMWEVVSVSELVRSGGSLAVQYRAVGSPGGTVPIPLKSTDAAIRVWTADPEQRYEAHSPFKSMLPVLGEIEDATKRIHAQYVSRLTGNGILMLPQGIEFEQPGGRRDPNQAGAFLRNLVDVAKAAIANPDSPSARLPVVTMVPDELLGKAEWLTFWSELDATTVENRREAIRRFALGMDLPPEQVLGMGGQTDGQHSGSNHWNVWAIEESTITMHVEPILDSIVASINTHYLRPALRQAFSPIGYDTTRLRLRPDRSKEAIELHDRGALSARVMRAENGFDEEDAPDRDERIEFLLWRLANGSANPAQVQAALSELGVNLPLAAVEGESATGPVEAQPPGENNDPAVTPTTTPSIADHPSRPSTPDSLVASVSDNEALMVACEAVVFRMLERAGAKLIRAHFGRKPPVTDPADAEYIDPMTAYLTLRPTGKLTMDSLLADHGSFAISVLSFVTDRPADLSSNLATYVARCVRHGHPHTREGMAEFLQEAS